MKLLVLVGVIVAGMSSCGASRVADPSPRAIACSHAAAGHHARLGTTIAP
ncbi:MAG TPA: hypothetical protein VHN39_15960 [Phenylobacterium sp.]|jgi:hypothetical protein|nr:hypothetical protein [Phenylobacterium sp.]